MQKLKIDVKKIDKTALFKGEKGTYLDLVLFENREGPDRYENDGYIVQDIPKERRDKGEKGPIIGNWKHVGQKPSLASQPAPRSAPPREDDDIPF